ncbi:hypothetical protein DRO58_02875 [Candidatus Bathyarchaeota archaeon]|nr:MAG: hypothetical protein DRO58_02875 [Candidatus Bathyarchaeota archaeon]
MVLTGLLPKEAGSIEGVIDTGVVVIAHFDNPARKAAFQFLKKVLAWERRCIIPVTAILGAYHIMTKYLGVEETAAFRALTRTLETRSPAFHEDISVDSAKDSLTYALSYKVESWDGYIIQLAKNLRAPIIYSVDRELARKVKEIQVINPIPSSIFARYTSWLSDRRLRW